MRKSRSILTNSLFVTMTIGVISMLGCKDPALVSPANPKKASEFPIEIKSATTAGLITVDERPNSIGPWNIKVMANRVTRLKATPEALNLKIGQQLELEKILIHAFDENGRDLGEVWGCSQNIGFKIFKTVDDKIVAAKPGESYIKITFPTYGMVKVTVPLPSVVVKLTVSE